MIKTAIVHLPSNLLETILAGAKNLHPRESFLLLRGKKRKNVIYITDLILAPFTVHGEGFAHFNPYMFSGDYSLVGTVHSHPSSNISPSDVDLNYFFGRILMIVGYPYDGQNCVAVYDSDGNNLPFEITAPIECIDEDFY